ncbi:alkaline phosphatase family protein [Candidatus Fermentibacteria bacterium]|nr:alkaline phosphatase family protein [Candidatus Fermentibacteria bacterium]
MKRVTSCRPLRVSLRVLMTMLVSATLIGCGEHEAGHARPVVVIGWDGATWDILDPLLAQGRLPVLQGLLARGTGGVLESTPLYVSPPAWVSLYSGKNPGKTGIFHFGSRRDDLPRLGDLAAGDVQTSRLWDIMSSQGRRCAIVNVPLTYPAAPLNGIAIADEFSPCILSQHRLIQVAEWDTLPAPGTPGRARVMLNDSPADLTVDVFRKPPWMTLRHARSGTLMAGPELSHLEWSPWFGVTVGEEEGWARVRLQSLSASRAVLWLSPVYRKIERFPEPIAYPSAWAETLRVRYGQFLPFVRWHWEPALEHLAWFGKMCRDVHAKERWDLFSCVFLTPDHMQHLYGDGEETVQILEELDRLTGEVLAEAPEDALVLVVSDHGFARFSRRVDVNRWLADLGVVRFGPDGAVLPESSLAWSTMWSIYVNERLLDAPARERLIQRLLDAAPEAVDPDNGRPLGLKLTRREDIYVGPFLHDAPHLVVTTAGEGYIPEFWDYKSGDSVRVLCRDTTRHTAWDHAIDGIIVAAGPGIAPQRARFRCSVYDIVPTVLAWAGLPLARDMDGRVVAELWPTGQTPAVTWCDTYDSPREPSATTGAATSLEDRLRSLGYIRGEH